jgi:hypothetical protein
MNRVSISGLNSLYMNIAMGSTDEGAWRYRVFHSNLGLKLKNAIQQVFRNADVLNQEHLKELKTLLQVSLTYSRILLSEKPAEDFWSEHIAQIKNSLEQSENYLDSSLQESIGEVITILDDSASLITQAQTKVVLSEIEAINGKILIFPETPRIGYFYREWINQLSFECNVEVLTDKGEIQGKLFEEYAMILFPGSPSRYLHRPFFDVYLRSLLFSGFAPRVTFVSPDWATFQSDLNFTERLFPGMKILSPPKLTLVQDEIASKIQEDNSYEIDLEYYENTSRDSNFESFESGGSVPCRFIQLGNNLAYPVEQDSKRVTVIKKNTNLGTWEIDSKHPFQELAPGDFIVACVGRSETNDLRERAAAKMGQKYNSFLSSQNKWKQLLQDKLDSNGIKAFEEQLKIAGVKKFTRARFWILPEAIQPGLPSDFQAMLRELGFKPQESQVAISLADQFDSLLITEGREAGKALTSALAEEDFFNLDKGLSVEITLENFGDATYLLSPVEGISEGEIDCKPSQVRQVISVEGLEILA